MYWLEGERIIVQYPLFRSNAVAYWNPYSRFIVLHILVHGYGFLTNLWLSLW